MAKKKKPKTEDDPLAVYQSLVDQIPDLKIKGAKSNYTSLNGNMFSFLTTDYQLALRLSADQRDEFLNKYPGMKCYQYGALMKHYVLIPDSLLQNKQRMAALFSQCYANAQSLKPKPTTRKAVKKSTKSGTKKVAAKKITKQAKKKK